MIYTFILNKAAPDQFHVTPPYRVGGGVEWAWGGVIAVIFIIPLT